MAKSGRVDVRLKLEAIEALNGTLRGLLKDGTHFNCEKVEQDGAFLRMRVVFPFTLEDRDDLPKTVDVSIPIQFVLYTITGGIEERLGFELTAKSGKSRS